MKARILVVDDSLTVRTDLEELFESAGFLVTTCASAALARMALVEEDVHLIVLDRVLPDSDGTELLREMKALSKTAEIPVMFLSSAAEVRDRIQGISLGAIEYVGKPYNRSYLVARAGELLARQARPIPPATPCVLVIDDSPTSQEMLKLALEPKGYVMHFAKTGEEGLRTAARIHPHAMIVDGQLPGIDGATVIQRVRSDAALRTTPCLLLTASESHVDEAKALEAGFDGYARKGSDIDVLLARLAAVLRSSRSTFIGDREGTFLGAKRVLAIDDSPTYLMALAESLRQDGHDVVTVSSGEQALSLLPTQPVDCILLDLTMPDLSGQETCRRIKASSSWKDIPLLMLTAREDRDAMLESFEAGADDYVPKSSELEVLKARLRAQLRRKQFEDENRRIRDELIRKKVEAAEAQANKELADSRARLLEELERTNYELESFSYSVSHDLRTPLRSILGFSRILLDECGKNLNDEGRDHLRRIINAGQQMGQLIDGLLSLSQLSRSELRRTKIDLTAIADGVVVLLKEASPERNIEWTIGRGIEESADPDLMQVVLHNLLSNAWKYSSKNPSARIEFGQAPGQDGAIYYVRDNGAGFDMKFADKLFKAFQRLHSASEFEGCGIGLASVQRVIQRHGGRIWADAKVNEGAVFYFTLNGAKG